MSHMMDHLMTLFGVRVEDVQVSFRSPYDLLMHILHITYHPVTLCRVGVQIAQGTRHHRGVQVAQGTRHHSLIL